MAKKTMVQPDNPQAGHHWRPGLLCVLNAAREAKRLSQVAMHAVLNKLAQAQARHCAALGRLDHTGEDGTDPFTRVAASGYAPAASTEVLAMGAPEDAFTVEAAVNAWLKSRAGHRQAVLTPGWCHCGLGRYVKSGTVYWCVILARPAMGAAD